ncbi:hypothetical protein CC80DRAFT_551850 [Byssothecium circinans]|uniref:Uncharacterized protein n=1 Tax=Byssothecium circinans TaxID=147558 RepID=A0A6A5TLN0_9PLEO|nr:hypothetical protein CC80DRAFT_551850 [Byssothecium circinans]
MNPPSSSVRRRNPLKFNQEGLLLSRPVANIGHVAQPSATPTQTAPTPTADLTRGRRFISNEALSSLQEAKNELESDIDEENTQVPKSSENTKPTRRSQRGKGKAITNIKQKGEAASEAKRKRKPRRSTHGQGRPQGAQVKKRLDQLETEQHDDDYGTEDDKPKPGAQLKPMLKPKRTLKPKPTTVVHGGQSKKIDDYYQPASKASPQPRPQ